MADIRDKMPLTVNEIVAFQRPANLTGWTLTRDVNGGYSYRATVAGINYIATPEEWDGRTLTTGTGAGAMGDFATNGVFDLHSQIPGTLETNDPAINRSLVPTSTSTSTPAPDASQSGPAFNHPGLIVAAILATFIVTSSVAGLLFFFARRRQHGIA